MSSSCGGIITRPTSSKQIFYLSCCIYPKKRPLVSCLANPHRSTRHSGLELFSLSRAHARIQCLAPQIPRFSVLFLREPTSLGERERHGSWVTCFLEAKPGPVPHGAHESDIVCYTQHPHHQPHIPLTPVSRTLLSCVFTLHAFTDILGRFWEEAGLNVHVQAAKVTQCPIHTRGPAVHLSAATDVPNSSTLPGIPLTLTRPGPQGRALPGNAGAAHTPGPACLPAANS